MGSLSYVKVLANFSTKTVRLTNHENNDDESCSPQDIDTAPSLFIPWAGSESDYKAGRKLAVGLLNGSGVLENHFWLWERSGQIYYNTEDKWVEQGTKVPGHSEGGWFKAFALKGQDGRLSISLSNIK